MQLKYDSDFCGSLPLNFINHIQPYGVLLVLEKETLNIVQVSQNIEQHLGISHTSIINQNLSKFVPEPQLIKLRQKFNSGIKDKLPFIFSFEKSTEATQFLSLIHAKDDYLLIEIETEKSSERDNSSFVSIYQELKFIMASIENAESLNEVGSLSVQELKKLSGFDRIMIYQFDENWNGIVIAEVLETGMEPYIGLRFPASDIPKQARALYQKNPYRFIPNREYEAVKLYPVINPVTQAFIDLADCNLRSVASVHVEYLKNMGVMASMSTRILVDGKLWGLIACHHREPKFLNYEMCSVFELLSDVISAKIASMQRQDDFRYSTSLQEIQSQLVEQIYSSNLLEGLTADKANILKLLRAEGAVISFNKRMEQIGTVPDNHFIQDLIFWLQTHNIDKVYAVDNISEVYDDGYQHSKIASGMIVLPIYAEKGEYIIAFRPEAIQNVDWGGNPNERIQFEENKKSYHPRNSFKLWQQTVKNTSLPWHRQEVAIAESFRNILLEYTMKKVYS